MGSGENTRKYVGGRNGVYEVQKCLRNIALSDKSLPLINPDGIYDSKTEEAVRIFQGQKGLEMTGKVDLKTWNALVEESEKAEFKASMGDPIVPFTLPSYVAKEGEKSTLVMIIQIILVTLSVVYDTFFDVIPDGVYGPATKKAVTEFQRANRLEGTGDVDKVTWNRLASNFNAYSENYNYTA